MAKKGNFLTTTKRNNIFKSYQYFLHFLDNLMINAMVPRYIVNKKIIKVFDIYNNSMTIFLQNNRFFKTMLMLCELISMVEKKLDPFFCILQKRYFEPKKC